MSGSFPRQVTNEIGGGGRNRTAVRKSSLIPVYTFRLDFSLRLMLKIRQTASSKALNHATMICGHWRVIQIND